MPVHSRAPLAPTRSLVASLVALTLAGCGGEASRAVQDAKNVAAVATSGGAITEAVDEATKFREERRAKGDTLPMTYQALQAMLMAPDGYTPEGGPEGASQAMAGFAMSQAKQRYVKGAAADGTVPTVEVEIVDFGASDLGYTTLAMPMMMNLSREDDQERMRTITLGPAHTWASEQYGKQDHRTRITAVTRYRYVVTVTAESQGSDQSAAITKFAEQLVRKFDGK
jgi:hypothetical protein